MTRLTKSEISKHREWLTAWRAPADMKDYVEDINDYMDSKDFLTQAGIEFLRDAWIGSRFAIQRGAELVRLVMDEWPDFEIRSGARIERFECTEADQEGRRRGDEYRKAETIAGPNGFILEDDPVENWIERASQASRILQMAIERKTNKHYGSLAQLVVYLNVNELGIRQKEVESCFSHVCKIGPNKFKAIWILWKEKIYGPFSARA